MNPPFTIQRLLKAPRPLVWEAYTLPQHLRNWFGPKGSSMPHGTMDLAVGGIFHYCLKQPGGLETWAQWHFKEIVAPEKIVLLQNFWSEHGGAVRHPMSPVWPLYTLSTTTFVAQGHQTIIKVQWEPFEANEEETLIFDTSHSSMRQSWLASFDALDAYLLKLQTKEA